MAASTPPPTRDPASAPAPLPGVAGLADRPVDERRVAWVMAAVAFALAAGCAAMVEALLASADAEPDGGRMLRDLAVPGPAPAGPPGRAAVVVVDGLRTDEAWSIEDAARATVAVPPPTRTTPALHTLLTGVPPGASGVRSNRFAGPARHDTVADRVRAAGGRVFVVADGDDTLRALIGRPEDGGSDAAGSLGAPLDAAVDAWRRAPEPALLLAHVLDVDRTAHAGGVGTAAHRAALAEAREVVARVARVARAADAALFVLGDHGHLGDGGHGGPERAVARTPLAARAPGLAPRTLDVPVPAERLASTLATWLGVPRPRSAAGPPVPPLSRGEPPPDPWYARAARLIEGGAEAGRLRWGARRRWVLPFVLVALVLALGPIKRAFGFDRSVPWALVGWPLVVVGGHLALGRPLSLSAVDERAVHVARVLALGLGAFALVSAIGVALARGGFRRRVRRVTATVGWSAAASASTTGAWVGFALGPWAPSPAATYLPLLAGGAASAALVGAGVVLLVTALGDRALGGRARSAASPPTGRT